MNGLMWNFIMIYMYLLVSKIYRENFKIAAIISRLSVSYVQTVVNSENLEYLLV